MCRYEASFSEIVSYTTTFGPYVPKVRININTIFFLLLEILLLFFRIQYNLGLLVLILLYLKFGVLPISKPLLAKMEKKTNTHWRLHALRLKFFKISSS
jgi:hypothetical protein